jgi:cyclic pyranopterin phosphate synthase
MPEEGITALEHEQILSFEEIQRIVKVAAGMGIKKVRLTGGEPLVRKDLPQLLRYIDDIEAIDDLSMTTNGILFEDQAEDLRAAGLNRVNISLDTLLPERFAYITRGGKIEKVKRAIFKALEMNMNPVKINTVVIKGFNDDELLDFAHLAYQYPLHIRFIEYMPVGDLLTAEGKLGVSAEKMRHSIEQAYTLVPGKKVRGNGPAKYYDIVGGKGSLGFINPISNHFCAECNRLRLTAEGKMRACLYDLHEIDLKPALADTSSDRGLRDLFIQAVNSKPQRHHMSEGWGQGNRRKMVQIGG